MQDIAALEDWFYENEDIFIVPYIEKNFPECSYNYEYSFMKQHLYFAKKIIENEAMSNDEKQDKLLNALSYGKSKIIIIEGSRGSGKSATAFWIVDQLHERNMHKKIYFVKTGKTPIGLPKWINHVQDMDEVPNNCLAIVDESSIKYNSRNSWSDENKDFVKRLVILRHKGISLLLITQHMKMLEIGARRLADIKIFKMGSNLTNEDEGTNDERALVRNRLRPNKKKDCLVEIPMFNKLFKFNHPLAPWFSNTLSKSFIDFNPEEQTKKNKAERFESIKEQYRMKKEIELAKIEKMKELGMHPNYIRQQENVLDI